MSRRVELSVGVVASALALVGIAFAVFGPATFSYGTNWVTAASVSLWDQGIGTAPILVYLAVMTAAALGIGVGAYRHSQSEGAGLTMLWSSAVLLLGGALLTLPGSDTAIVPGALHTGTPDSVGIGAYMILPALVALAAAVVETAVHGEPRRPATLRPH